MLLGHVLAVPEAGIRNPIKSPTRGRPKGSTQRLLSQFEHVVATLEAPGRLRQCRPCQRTGHNARTCRRQAQEAVTTAPAITAPAATTVDSEALYWKV